MQTTTLHGPAHPLAALKRPAFGHAVFAIGIAGLGVQTMVLANFPPGLGLMPTGSTGGSLGVIVSGILMTLVSIDMLANWRTRLAALALTALLICGLVVSLPRLIAAAANGGAWVVSVFELIALAGSAMIAAARAPGEALLSAGWNRLIERSQGLGIASFGLSSVVFGVVHFFYPRAIATLIPAWIPGALVWVYGIGALRIAGGLVLLTPFRTRLVAALMAVMYGTWVLILHVPRVAAHGASGVEWTLLLLAIAFCGGAWMIATQEPSRRSPTTTG